jgi:alcohol dehydrogenase class IV
VSFEFATASRIVFGNGASRQVGELARVYGTRALVVTGRSAERAEFVRSLLAQEHVSSVLLCAEGEPTTEQAEAGVELARTERVDVVVGIGGGSALDLGKAVAALLTNPGDPLEYLEVVGRGRALAVPPAPYLALPTTSGTGTEVTRNAVLASSEHRVKVSLRSPMMLPKVALVDPELVRTVPPGVTASTGFDAIAQVIEPYVCNRPNPLTDALCVAAIERAAPALRRAFGHGDDLEARSDMAFVSLVGGLALANARLGAVHGFAGPIGGMFGAPHGALCAALLPHVMAANVAALRQRDPESSVLERYRVVAQRLCGSDAARAEDGIALLAELAAHLGIAGLSCYGITSDHHADIVAKSAMASSMQGNPIRLSEEELRHVLEAAS